MQILFNFNFKFHDVLGGGQKRQTLPWRTHDFPDGGETTPKGRAPTYYLAKFLPKTTWK